MYCVVEFTKTRSVAVVCESWITKDKKTCLSGTIVTCLWSNRFMNRAVLKDSLITGELPTTGIQIYDVVILRTTGIFYLLKHVTSTGSITEAFKIEEKVITGKSHSSGATSECVDMDASTPKRSR